MTQKTVTLDNPIHHGEQTISEIVVRKPMAGQLRGLNMTDILQMDVNALSKLLPRITSPALTEVDISAMDPADRCNWGRR